MSSERVIGDRTDSFCINATGLNQSNPKLTIFHVTHWKAGSQWVGGIMKDACRERIVKVRAGMFHVTEDPIVAGGVYSPVYLDYRRFMGAVANEPSFRAFFVLRDLRDTLVSMYFSLKISHGVSKDTAVGEIRKTLNSLSFEEGLEHLMGDQLNVVAGIQRSWLQSDQKVFRYEDLIANDQSNLVQIRDHCELNISDDKWDRIVHDNSFATVSGREPGEEDRTRHQRKGIAGDWKNHFSPGITIKFKEMFGELLIRSGYEQDLEW